jgi:lysozyme family protein
MFCYSDEISQTKPPVTATISAKDKQRINALFTRKSNKYLPNNVFYRFVSCFSVFATFLRQYFEGFGLVKKSFVNKPYFYSDSGFSRSLRKTWPRRGLGLFGRGI